MIEIRIHGRGGQGGVTLAKIIATTRFLRGCSVQAFGLYAAERSGAPLQAFCRFDEQPITTRNLIYEPDHIIVLDATLVGPAITSGLKPNGWILINSPRFPYEFAEQFPGYRVATVDATSIARDHELGTRSVPIVNTALAGAVARILDLELESVREALEHLGFRGKNFDAAREAYERVVIVDDIDQHGAKVVRPTIPTARVPGPIFGGGADRPAIRTGQWATQQPHRRQWTPPCNHVCPAGNDVQGFLQALARKQTDLALETLLRTTPFPSVCGRVCPAPCMETCNRVTLDEAVNVRELERYAGDCGQADVAPLERRTQHVAIVGSGPAGLSAAYHLARLGYQVALIEGGATLGGLLRTGIPPYRLPRDVLDREIDRIVNLGVEVRLNHRVGRRELFALAAEFDAVLVATGLQELRRLDLGAGGDGQTVMQGIEFLDRANRDEIRVKDEEVVVVGGGNTAFDAARSALRLGAAGVRIVYRRTREEMPSIAEEIEEAIEEGVRCDYLTLPIRIDPAARNSRLSLVCRRMELGLPDESGRRRPIEIEGSDFVIGCDRVLLALGQSPDLSVLPEGTEVREGTEVLGLLETPVYTIGDLVSNDGTVAGAIGSGRRAALSIHYVFAGEDLPGLVPPADQVIRAGAMKMHLFESAPSQHGMSRPAEERRFDSIEVHPGLTDASEAERCLSCRVCNECDRCVTYCPEGVLKRVGHEFIFDYEYCKGCGVCAAECPRNVVFMTRL